ncbi:MAG TPA: GNAT family N-acetyltransferase [Azospirillum sp.]|nr:GNAT family N-acetyltransferase [Azospirillum sp.]
MTVRLRPATAEDAAELFRWRNDPLTRRQSLTTDAIPWDAHVAWLGRVLADPERTLLIAEVDGAAVGSVRCDADGAGKGVLSWQIAPERRGRGYASAMLKAAVADGRLAGLELWAEIKPDNAASRRAALAAGFTCAHTAPDLTSWRRGPRPG